MGQHLRHEGKTIEAAVGVEGRPDLGFGADDDHLARAQMEHPGSRVICERGHGALLTCVNPRGRSTAILLAAPDGSHTIRDVTGFRGDIAITARRARPAAGRAGWGLIDQAFSSLTNFALGIIIARSVPVAEFGAFSLAFAAYLLVVNMTRAFPMQPLAIRYSAVTPDIWRRGSAAALGSVLLVGLVVGSGVHPDRSAPWAGRWDPRS